MANGSGSPCGACKFLRRKCAADCIFAPYFCTEQGPARFAAIHKVFGASNVSKLLLHVPVPERCEAVVTIAYEAQARIKDPVYGCVAHIFALQQQVAYLQAQLMQARAQLAQAMIDSSENHWPNNMGGNGMGSFQTTYPSSTNYANNNSISPQSSICSLDSIDPSSDGIGMQEEMIMKGGRDQYQTTSYSKKRPSQTDLGELQALALRMMKS
ncbi:hypothetical protein ACH5RR_020263 [Cinchona calisaya]|uniref:LOB domain-containing protein n=1 Tax=Cinchona calisaya TaxID=153742 RepID=A0ABD2ZF65_9GENT